MPGPQHPYQLHQEFSRELGRVWRVGQSHFYAHLKQAAAAGWASVQTEPQPNRPPRTVYHLTPAGREMFLAWLRQPTPHVRHIRLEFLARLYFFRRLALPGLEQLVSDQKALLRTRIEGLSHSIAKANGVGLNGVETDRVETDRVETDGVYWRLVLEFRRGETEAALAWLERCMQIT